MHKLSYGVSADYIDKNIHTGESAAMGSLGWFCNRVVDCSRTHNSRTSKCEDLRLLLKCANLVRFARMLRLSDYSK